jgi:nudix motif 8
MIKCLQCVAPSTKLYPHSKPTMLPTCRLADPPTKRRLYDLIDHQRDDLQQPLTFMMIGRRLLQRRRSGSGFISFSTSLEEALPHLIDGYKKTLNSEGDFPLLTQHQLKQFGKKYNWNDTSQREASVLVLLCSIEGSISVLFTRRAAHLNLHASEISFPGGHHQADLNESLEQTALREANEELWPNPLTLLNEDNLVIVGKTTRIPSLKGTPVTSIIACLPHLDLQRPLSDTFPGDPSEVDVVFGVSVQDLLRKETSEQLPDNRFGMQMAPVFPTDEHGKIWGLTALILRPLLHRWLQPVLLGRDNQ